MAPDGLAAVIAAPAASAALTAATAFTHALAGLFSGGAALFGCDDAIIIGVDAVELVKTASDEVLTGNLARAGLAIAPALTPGLGARAVSALTSKGLHRRRSVFVIEDAVIIAVAEVKLLAQEGGEIGAGQVRIAVARGGGQHHHAACAAPGTGMSALAVRGGSAMFIGHIACSLHTCGAAKRQRGRCQGSQKRGFHVGHLVIAKGPQP